MTGRQENGNKLFGIMIKIKYINASKLVSCDEVLSDLFSKCQKYQVTEVGKRGTSEQGFFFVIREKIKSCLCSFREN